MALPVYLAMTGEEMQHCPSLPQHLAYMACHFSPYGTGLTNLPSQLSPGALLIVNDRIPPSGSNPKQIASQLLSLLKQFFPAGILLDFQRPGCKETAAIAKEITEAMPIPVAVSQFYAKTLCCPVFLNPPPLHCKLETCLAPWKHREIWLDIAFHACRYTVTQESCTPAPCGVSDSPLLFEDAALHCHYQIQISQNQIFFTLQRTGCDLEGFLDRAQQLGVQRAVGLFQELG